jgi:hypothetical protein
MNAVDSLGFKPSLDFQSLTPVGIVLSIIYYGGFLLAIIIVLITLIMFFIEISKVKKSMLNDSQKKEELSKIYKLYKTRIIISIIVALILSFVSIVSTAVAGKPIIYLYPETDTEVTVSVGKPDKLTTSYPKYTTGWKVLAHPNGDLKDLDTNKNLYSLYYECNNTYRFKIEKDGFVVKGKDVADFLEEKLEILGLNYKEKEEFIVYWLPKLEANKYNYIRFATNEEIDANMPLEISPKPDTTIRVLMTFKGLDKPINVEEQQLEAVERKGFVAVEWGGTEIK